MCVEEKNYTNANAFFEKAISLYQELKLPAAEMSVVNSIASIYEKQKDYSKAIEIYGQALALFPDQASYIFRNRALMRIKIKDPLGAKEDLDRAEELQPNSPYLFLRRGQLAILTGECQRSLEFFEAALAHYPRMNDAFFGIGLAQLHLGHETQALEAYQQGLDVTDTVNELEDAMDELKELRGQGIPGAQAALDLLKGWSPSKSQ